MWMVWTLYMVSVVCCVHIVLYINLVKYDAEWSILCETADDIEACWARDFVWRLSVQCTIKQETMLLFGLQKKKFALSFFVLFCESGNFIWSAPFRFCQNGSSLRLYSMELYENELLKFKKSNCTIVISLDSSIEM